MKSTIKLWKWWCFPFIIFNNHSHSKIIHSFIPRIPRVCFYLYIYLYIYIYIYLYIYLYMTWPPLECFLMYRHIKGSENAAPPKKRLDESSTLLSFGAEIQWRTLKSSSFRLRLSDFYFENMFGVVRQFSSKWRANQWNPTKIDRTGA